MYKVIIVDDEKQILDGLSRMIKWAEFGFEVCATARNGLEAMQLIKIHNADLVLTDVKMPRMDGLKMVECIRKSMSKDIEFIILSGFSEFQYAQKAMQYNVKKYILKPIDEAELYATLIDIKNILDEKELGNNQKIKTYINNIITGDNYVSNELVLENEEIYGLRYLAIEKQYEVSSLTESNDNNDTDADLACMISDKICQYNMRFVLKHDKNKCHMVVGKSLLSCHEYDVKHLAKSIYEFLLKNKSMKVNIFIGKKVAGFRNLHESIQSITKCKNECFYLKWPSIVMYDDIKDKQFCKLFDDNGEVIRIISAFRKNDMERLKETIVELIGHFTNLRVAPEIALIHLDRIMAYIIQILSERTDDTREALYLYSIYKQIQGKLNIQRLGSLVIEFSMICNTLSTSNLMGDNADIVGKVIQYVEENFMDHLRIADIAEHFFVNPAYLGQQFIKKKGCSLNHYINTVRIEKSKELLLNTNLKIYEIAEKVGYEDPNYFSAKYFEYTNNTPSEYRQQGIFNNSSFKLK